MGRGAFRRAFCVCGLVSGPSVQREPSPDQPAASDPAEHLNERVRAQQGDDLR